MAIRGTLGPMVVAALLAVPVVAAAECKTGIDQDAVTVESCPVGRTGYSLVQSRTTAAGTVGAVVHLLLTDEERGTGGAPEYRSVLHTATGEGFRLRVAVTRRSWWRLDDGAVVLDVVGADDLATDLQGTRLLCLACAVDDHAGRHRGHGRHPAAVRERFAPAVGSEAPGHASDGARPTSHGGRSAGAAGGRGGRERTGSDFVVAAGSAVAGFVRKLRELLPGGVNAGQPAAGSLPVAV